MNRDLTNSSIDRANILNNSYAIEKIQEYIGITGILFEWSYRFTKKQVADFYEVDERTLERYLEQNDGEIRKSGYEVLTGERLAAAKNVYVSDMNVAHSRVVNLWLFNFRSFLNIGMLLSESEKAKIMRASILDIVLDTIHQKTWGNTKYINQREEDYLIAAVRDNSCRKEFTDALDNYVAMWNVKYAIYTNRIYESIFRENANEYKAILRLSSKENLRDTMYSEVLTTISSYELGLAYELKNEFERLGRKLKTKEVDLIVENFANHPAQMPYLETARMKMASRDIHFRDALHEKLSEYVSAIPQDDFEKFLWERSKIIRSKDRGA
jgi:hypothetical protein